MIEKRVYCPECGHDFDLPDRCVNEIVNCMVVCECPECYHPIDVFFTTEEMLQMDENTDERGTVCSE